MWLIRKFLVVSLLAVCTQSLATPTDYKFKPSFNIGSQPTGAIIQDSNDFLWFGSFFSGLVRFDGNQVKKFRAGENSITNDYVTQLLEAKNGIIWIGSNDGLTAYNKKKNSFTQYYRTHKGDPSSIIGNTFNLSSPTIAQQDDGQLWFGTQQGLSSLNPITGLFTHYQHDVKDANSLSDNNIYAVTVDGNDDVWVGTKNGGLNKFNPIDNNFVRFMHSPDDASSIPANDIHSITIDRQFNYWLGSKTLGLIKFYPRSNKFQLLSKQYKFPKTDLWGIKALANGRLNLTYLANSAGFVTFNPSTGEVEQIKATGRTHSLSSSTVNATFEDKSGILWLAQAGGEVDMYDPNAYQFDLYQNNPDDSTSIGSNSPIPIFEDSKGEIFIGLFGAGLDRFDPKSKTFSHFPAIENDSTTLPGDYPSGFYEYNDKLIVSTPKGLAVFDRDTNKVSERLSTDTWFYTMVGDANDNDVIWAGGWEQNFNRFNLKTKEHQVFKHDPNDPSSFSAKTALRTIKDNDNPQTLWIATWGGGLEQFDTVSQTFNHHQNDPNDKSTINSNTIYDLLQDSNGMFWVATDIGLNLFNKHTNKFSTVPLQDARTIQNIQQDSSGTLWLGTDIGLIHFDGKKQQIIKVYTKEDGLHSHSFFATAKGQTRDGQIWIGGMGGLNSFYPAQLNNNEQSPNIFLTGISQDGVELHTETSTDTLTTLNLPFDKNYIEFEYAALNFSNSHKNQYRYKLIGYDKNWYDAGTKTSGRYANLPPGSYTLRIRGSNNDGYWSKPTQEVQLQITVATPLWHSISAYVIYAIGTITIILSLLMWRITTVKKRSAMLEKTVATRIFELEQQKELMQEQLDSQEHLIVTTNGQRLLSANKSYINFFGFQSFSGYQERFEHKKLSELFIAQTRSENNNGNWLSALTTDNSDNRTTTIRKKIKVNISRHDQPYIFTVAATRLSMGNGVTSLIFTDITAIEQARKKLNQDSVYTGSDNFVI